MTREPKGNHSDPDTPHSEEHSGIRKVFGRLGDKWSLSIMRHIGDKQVRFAELRRNVGGISNRVLAAGLRNLESDGLVARSVRPTAPPQVHYRLTPLGQHLLAAIDTLAAWYDSHDEGTAFTFGLPARGAENPTETGPLEAPAAL